MIYLIVDMTAAEEAVQNERDDWKHILGQAVLGACRTKFAAEEWIEALLRDSEYEFVDHELEIVPVEWL